MWSLDKIKDALNLYSKRKTYKITVKNIIENILYVPRSTFYTWVNNKEHYNELSNRKSYKNHNISKITFEIKDYIKSYLDNNKFLKIKELLVNIINIFNTCISKSYLYKLIKKLGYSYKKVQVCK